MFAVPGWSIDAKSLAVQTSENQGSDGSPAASNPSKKRKRGIETPKQQLINPDDLGTLWAKVIEGREQPRPGENLKKDRKRLKNHGPHEVGTRPDMVTRPVTDGERELVEKLKTSMVKDCCKNCQPIEKEKGHDEDGGYSQDPKNKYTKNKYTSSKRDDKKRDDNKKHNTLNINKSKSEQGSQIHTDQKGLDINTTRSKSKEAPPPRTLTPLQSSMRQKLISARFRHINETLYTTPSTSAMELFTTNPTMFSEYHEGFRAQVSVWPENPLDSYISALKTRGASRSRDSSVVPLPRTAGVCHVADLGCGDATLAQALSKEKKKLKIDLRSFDLHASNELVTKADIADLPLSDGAMDIVVLCLALMGTNWIEFIEEAWRILRWKGELWIAETRSRFVRREAKGRVGHSVGNRRKEEAKKAGKRAEAKEEEAEENLAAVEVDGVKKPKGEDIDVERFVEVLRRRGLVLGGIVDAKNKMFVRMAFVKSCTPTRGKGAKKGVDDVGISYKKPKLKFLDDKQEDDFQEAAVLKPCVYKLR